MWRGGLSLKQVEMLEATFAYLTDSGWVIPSWLISLRAKVIANNQIEEHHHVS